MNRTSWHPAFVEAIQLELEEYRDVLEFLAEYQLTAEPLQMDVLIIKKQPEVKILKNIGQIFLTYNVIEYKSPNDYASVDDYNKAHGYSRFYASLHGADTDEMTVTIVVTKKPRKLLKYLSAKFIVTKIQPGIYYVAGDTSDTQIVVSSELPESDNLWVRNLSNELSADGLTAVLQEKNRRGKETALNAYIDVVLKTNPETLLEVKEKMTITFDEAIEKCGLAAKWRNQGREWGRTEGIVEGEAEGIIKGKAEGIVEGEARGKAEGQVLAILCVIKARFGSVPKTLQKRLFKITDLTRLEKLVAQAAICPSLDVFGKQV